MRLSTTKPLKPPIKDLMLSDFEQTATEKGCYVSFDSRHPTNKRRLSAKTAFWVHGLLVKNLGRY